VVEVLLGDDPNLHRVATLFGGDPPWGYLGVITRDGNVRVRKGELMEIDHSEIGYGPHDGRWRFATNRKYPLVLWATDPNESQKMAVETWLNDNGFPVRDHTTDFNRWRGY